jgi:hypothetical protein
MFSSFAPWCVQTRISTNESEGEKPHQGVAAQNPVLFLGRELSKSRTALGLALWAGKTVSGPAVAANNGTDPSCGITVKCRGIEYGKLGKLGFQHCDAQVTTSSGQVWSLSGGPQPYGDITALNAWAISPPTAPFTGTTVYQGNSCSAGQCMIQSTQAWNKDVVKPIYSATSGPNSNTWLKGTAAGCGVSLPINTWGSIW